MTFVLAADGRDDDVVGAFRRYRTYLESVRGVFPPSAYALATSDWYFNFDDRRSPHDAWLETFDLCEKSSGARREKRSLSLCVRLLGAHHDGHMELRYPKVFAYSLSSNDSDRGSGDWRYDELRLSERGNLLHEIEWSGGGTWSIEASDLAWEWISKDQTS